MRAHSPENSYIRHIDQGPSPDRNDAEGKERTDVGFEAEEVVLDFFQNQFPGVAARPASPDEDRGHTGIDSGKQIDAVLYRQEKPWAGLQITTARDPQVRLKKMAQLKDRPFVRLPEMNLQETSIPKAIIAMEPDEVRGFLLDHDWSKHPKLSEQIITGMENSLLFDILKTQNPREKALAEEMLKLVKEFKEARKEKTETVH